MGLEAHLFINSADEKLPQHKDKKENLTVFYNKSNSPYS